jgi:paraquat-inducible protein B
VSDNNDGSVPELPKARTIRSRWPGLIWAVPIAALMVVGFLGVRALFDRGVDVVVTFTSAAGVTPGDTKVIVQGVQAGHVQSVRVAEDGLHVDVTLRLDPRERGALNTATQFWLVGGTPSLTDLSSLKAALAGATIAMAPGVGGEPTTHFVGLPETPVIPLGTKGTRYMLDSRTVGSIQPGGSIIYRGQEIGKVVKTELVDFERFKLEIFILAPFDRLVRTGSAFWIGSPFNLSLTGDGIKANLAPTSFIQGLLQFDVPQRARETPVAAKDTTFVLYGTQAAALLGDTGVPIPYEVVFTGTAGDLAEGASVTLLGTKVGEVRNVDLFLPAADPPYTVATILLYPVQLGVTRPEKPDARTWRDGTDTTLQLLLAQGYRPKLTQSPPLIGSRAIVLAMDDPSRGAALTPGILYPQIPAATAGADTDMLISQANDILSKINQIPFVAIGANLQSLTAHVDALAGSPKVDDSLTHLDNSLRQLDQILADLKPKIGTLATKLNQTADQARAAAAAARGVLGGEGTNQDQSLADVMRQIDQAARSIRSLTDYLGRHPESLLGGKSKESR